MFQMKKKLTALALAGAVAAAPMTGFTQGIAAVTSPSAMVVYAYETDATLGIPVSTGITGTVNSITLNWSQVEGAEKYLVYQLIDGKYKKIKTVKGLSATITGLQPSTTYRFKVCAAKTVDGSTVRSKASAAMIAKTGTPSSVTAETVKLKSVSSNTAQTMVKLSWYETNCTGVIVYAASYPTGPNKKDPTKYKPSWKKVAVVNGGETSVTFNTNKKASGGSYALADLNCGGRYGYRFAVVPYVSASGKTTKGKTTMMSEPVYNINAVTNSFGSEYTLLKKVLSKCTKSSSLNSYKIYETEKSGNKYKSTSSTYTISAAERAVLDKFAKKHFKSGWSDAQKITYTINWINKNMIYETNYSIGNYTTPSERAFEYKLGQCDAYNGAVASMITYLGYKNVYLQKMCASTTDYGQHFRAEMEVGGKTYSIEAGNASKSGAGWIWICQEFDEVPLK